MAKAELLLALRGKRAGDAPIFYFSQIKIFVKQQNNHIHAILNLD
jgi:hypothetical protein